MTRIAAFGAVIFAKSAGKSSRWPGSGGVPGANAKNSTAYGQRDVFLVSDSNWRRVFTTVPAARSPMEVPTLVGNPSGNPVTLISPESACTTVS